MRFSLGHSIRLPLPPEMEAVHEAASAVQQVAGQVRDASAHVSGAVARGEVRQASDPQLIS